MRGSGGPCFWDQVKLVPGVAQHWLPLWPRDITRSVAPCAAPAAGPAYSPTIEGTNERHHTICADSGGILHAFQRMWLQTHQVQSAVCRGQGPQEFPASTHAAPAHALGSRGFPMATSRTPLQARAARRPLPQASGHAKHLSKTQPCNLRVPVTDVPVQDRVVPSCCHTHACIFACLLLACMAPVSAPEDLRNNFLDRLLG